MYDHCTRPQGRVRIETIIKDEYTQAGTAWRHEWTLEKLGPTIVEQATCETMMMPRYRNPDGSGAC